MSDLLFREPPETQRRHDEDALNRAVIQHLQHALVAPAFVFHIPNEGMRSKKANARLIGMGLRKGMPDLCILADGRPYFIELKVPGRYRSAAQVEIHAKLLANGIRSEVCRSVPEVEAVLDSWGVRLRARVMA